MEPVIEMKNISKTFGSVAANRNVNLSLYPGEIHALLGENGAGKSTLMNILTGIYKADSGEIFFKGKKTDIHSPKDAVKLDIGMVHQHFRLISTLTVAENISLYSDKRDFFVKTRQIEREISECSKRFKMDVDPSAKIWQLSVGEQQRVEILKLLYRGAQVLILDEPSAVLTPLEADGMFRTLRSMAEDGKAVIVISHKMHEVMKNADRITVLKDGIVEDTMPATEATIERLTKGVVGNRAFEHKYEEKRKISDEKAICIKHVSAINDKGLTAVKDISFDIRTGEIFGIAGVAGNGQRELAEVIAGIRKAAEGEILLKGNNITKASIRERINEGVSFISEDRLGMGLVPDLDMTGNVILKEYRTEKYSKYGVLQSKSIIDSTEHFIKEYDIRHGGLGLPVGLMSGGNQQKLLVAREIDGDPVLIIAAYPVRGLDIGATEEIRNTLTEASLNGTAVLFISEELEDLFKMCDRIGVLCSGEMIGIRNVQETNFDEVGRMMAGEREVHKGA